MRNNNCDAAFQWVSPSPLRTAACSFQSQSSKLNRIQGDASVSSFWRRGKGIFIIEIVGISSLSRLIPALLLTSPSHTHILYASSWKLLFPFLWFSIFNGFVCKFCSLLCAETEKEKKTRIARVKDDVEYFASPFKKIREWVAPSRETDEFLSRWKMKSKEMKNKWRKFKLKFHHNYSNWS